MLGKTLYIPKVRDNKIIVDERIITKVGRKLYHFGNKSCYISDVGVVVFLAKHEAMDFLINRFRRSIKMGHEYIARERLLLDEALKPDADDETIRFRNFYFHCKVSWKDDCSAVCDDKCPVCNLSIGPYKSEDI